MSKQRASTIPRRNLLTDQTAQCILNKITEGEWQHEMPTEATLCRELQVSRVTLRRALQQLTDKDYIIPAGRGGRRRINPKVTKAKEIPKGRIIRVLAPFTHWKMGALNNEIIEGLAHRASTRDLRVEFESRPQLFQSHRPKELERLTALPDTVGWVLLFSTEPMQRWFAKRKIPCVVVGQLHEKFKISSAYPDNVAVAKHAAGTLVARGHTHIAELIARQTSLGDRLGSIAFQEEARKLGAQTRLVEYDSNPESVCQAMNSLMLARPRPTAIYLTCPEDAVTLLCHTLKAGFTVPGQVDILVGWDDPILDCTTPPLSHYAYDAARMGREIGTLILRRIENRGAVAKEKKFLGTFIPGGTLVKPVAKPGIQGDFNKP